MENNNGNERLLAETRRFAHDLRGPVMALQSVLNETRRGSGGPETNGVLNESARRLLDMSMQYLDFHKNPQAAVPPVVREQMNVFEFRKLSKKCLEVFAQTHRKSNVKISFFDFTKLQIEYEFGMASKQAYMVAQKSELERALLNLLANALEACENISSPQITLTTYIEEKQLKLEIQDNGVGMTQQEKLMALSGVSSKPDGNGIGLSSSVDLVHSWGGVVRVRSAKNKGTSIVLSLPVNQISIN